MSFPEKEPLPAKADMPRVSVIIPCYNQGAFLDESVGAVLSQTFHDWEIIVVNDGSTDQETNRRCEQLSDPRIKVITTDNQGLAAARNNGIAASIGEYILPLDADDRIAPLYLEEAVAVLDNHPEVGIVYCRARLFGAVDVDWLLPEYSITEMVKDNVIFCTALFRRADWQLVGGYDTEMIYGWEDYDFWLSLIERGRQVRRLEGTYFFYRVAAESMVRSKEKWQKVQMFKRIFERHAAFLGEHIETWIEALLDVREPYRTCRLYVDCGQGLSDGSSVARKIEPGRRIIAFPIEGFVGRQGLRFDPADCPAVVEVDSIELLGDGWTEVIEGRRLESNAAIRDANRHLFATADPQIYLPLTAKDIPGIREIRVSCEIGAMGEEALREIIDNLQQGKKPSKWSAWFGRLADK